MRVLNLYAGIGGNRKLWPDTCKVTAIENQIDRAKAYCILFPKDTVIVADAHQYLLDHYSEYDFIWSSPPCPSHSGCNNFLNPQGLVRYPDMKLYQEIIFLKHFFKGKWVVENVKPYYKPLIDAQESGRHLFWCNFYISNWKDKDKEFMNTSILNARASTKRTGSNVLLELEKYIGLSLDGFKLKDKRHALRDCVKPELGLHVFNCAFKTKQEVLF